MPYFVDTIISVVVHLFPLHMGFPPKLGGVIELVCSSGRNVVRRVCVDQVHKLLVDTRQQSTGEYHLAIHPQTMTGGNAVPVR